MLKNQKGITLVALVVTIVVLIILATISITIALNGGLIKKTEDAAKLQEQKDEEFEAWQQNIVNYIDDKLTAYNATLAS